MRSAKRIALRFPAMALSAEPAAMRADDLAAVGAMLQIGRGRRLWHRAALWTASE